VYTGSYFIHKLYGGQGLLIILWIYAIAGNQCLFVLDTATKQITKKWFLSASDVVQFRIISA